MQPHKAEALFKYLYLESWGQVVLEEPELDWSFCVLQHRQHHDPGRGADRLAATGKRRRREKEGKKKSVCSENRAACRFFQELFFLALSARLPEAHLRNLSYRWPEATEKMLITSSFGCFCSSTAAPPPNPLNHTADLIFFFFLSFEESLASVSPGFC